MAEPDNALDLILREVGVLLQPMQMAAAGPEQRAILFEALGWDLNAITGLPIAQIEQTVSALSAIADDLADGVDVSDFARIAQALPRAGEAFDAFNTIEATVRQTLPGIPAESLAADLINYVILRYLALRFPRIYAVLNVLTLIDEPATPRQEIIATTQATVYHARPKSALRLDRLPRLFSEPAELFKEVYWPDGFTTQAHANEVADRLFPRLASLIATFGGDVTYGITPVAGLTFGPGGDPLVPHMLTLRVPLPTYVADDGSTLRSAVSLTAGLVAGGNGDTDPGVILLPAAEAVFVVTTPTWQFEIEAGIAPVTFLVTRQGAFPDTADAQGDAKVTVQRLPGQAGAAVLIGSRDGTHFAIETISMQAGAHFAATGVDPEIGFDLLGGRLVIKAGDGDGFLKSVLPPDGMRMPFDFGMTWTPKTGVTFRGGATLELELPINLDLSIIKIPSMYLSLGLDIDPGRDPGVTLGVAATIELSIGPVYATVEQMGVAFMFTFPPHGGNLGALNLGIGFKPPKGMGASVSAGPVKGGGYLFIDAEKGEYAGILHLEIAGKFAITAIGLLNTRFPDGSEGFSLVVIISAEFPPINIGYGFFISGFGGIVGINRAMHVPALQDGIRRGVVGSLLFPVNPMPRARQIVADVGAIFPPVRDQFVVGPMVKFGWGQGMIAATLAIVVQIPSFKIALIGRIQIELPPIGADSAIAVLRIDFAGIIDVPAKTISFDGSLDGSRVAAFTITGDIALRAGWGEQANFAMAGGGWYPGYTPPEGFPTLKRLAISLATGDNPRLRLEKYFAFTPATIQFGGRAEVYYGVDIAIVGKIEIDAAVSLDAILKFPAEFEARFNVHVLLRRNGDPFIGVELDVRLTGVKPIVLDGHASVHFMGTHSIPFHKEIGGQTSRPQLDPVDVHVQVLAALSDRRAWSADAPVSAGGVRLRDAGNAAADAPPRLHPLGALAVHQTVAPLDVGLQKFGDAPISGSSRLELTGFTIGGGSVDRAALTPVKEQFATSQFFRLTDRQRITQPPFEPMQAGAKLTANTIHCTATRTVTPTYEDLVIPVESTGPTLTQGVTVLSLTLVSWSVGAEPAATRGPAANASRFAAEPFGIGVEREPRWAVVDPQAPTTAGRLAATATFATAAEAAATSGRGAVIANLQETSA